MEGKSDGPVKRSFSLTRELAERLEQERAKFEQQHGVSVSLNQVAIKAMRDGLRLEEE